MGVSLPPFPLIPVSSTGQALSLSKGKSGSLHAVASPRNPETSQRCTDQALLTPNALPYP